MIVSPGNIIHIGQRTEQQDCFALSDFDDEEFIAHGGYLAVVCDGIGGLQYGAEAAAIATDSFMSSYLGKDPEQSVAEALDTAVKIANFSVLESAHQHNSLENMGTTLIAVVVHEGRLHWRSVGDSHIYLYRRGRLSQLNPDHNVARMLQAQVDQGQITQQEADATPQRNALCSYIGMSQLHEIGASRQSLILADQDRILLCSDGVFSTLNDSEIGKCLQQSDAMQSAQMLCDQTLDKFSPTQDNLTAIVLACHETASLGERLRKTWGQWLNRPSHFTETPA
jgi:PPM family protein phosphatase